MGQKITQYFNCSIHGTVEGHKCIQCEAEKYRKDLLAGKVDNAHLTENEEPEPNDPRPTLLTLRTAQLLRSGDDQLGFCNGREGVHLIALTDAEDVIDFLYEAIPQKLNIKFWDNLRLLVDRQLGRELPIKTYPLSTEQKEKFLEEVIPMGRYAGRKVKQIWRKDPKHLMKMCYRPSLFQAKLRRLMMNLVVEAEQQVDDKSQLG